MGTPGVVTGRMRDPNGFHDGRGGGDGTDKGAAKAAGAMAEQSGNVAQGLDTAGSVAGALKGVPYVGQVAQGVEIGTKVASTGVKMKAQNEAKMAKHLSGKGTGGMDDANMVMTGVGGAVSVGGSVKGAVGGKGDGPKADGAGDKVTGDKGADGVGKDLKADAPTGDAPTKVAEAPKADTPKADVPKPSPAAAQKLELHADASAAREGKGKKAGSVLDQPEVRALL